MPVVDPTPAVLHAADEDHYLTVNQSFPFQQTRPVQSVINREDLFVPAAANLVTSAGAAVGVWRSYQYTLKCAKGWLSIPLEGQYSF